MHCTQCIHKHKEYCYPQMIRYSPWDDENVDQIKNVDMALNGGKFFKTTSPEILESIKYNFIISLI